MFLPTTSLVLITLLAAVNAIEIEKVGSAYKNIHVAIHRNIPESTALIDGIKKLFTSGSVYLFNATNKLAYFSDVTIVIPETWNKTLVNNTVYNDYYDESHVRIADANPEYGDAPYTLQPGHCGDPGIYVHFTPTFVLNQNEWTTEAFGEPGKHLVHEWAHLRYGVFDEYGIPGSSQYPVFYQMEGKVYPTSCVKGIKGWIERSNGEPCVVYKGKVSDDCLFIPNLAIDENRASLMYMPYLPKVSDFCDSKSQPKTHSKIAPSMHNAMCDFKSTWEVINAHKDFASSSGQPDRVPETKFRIVRKSEELLRTVLVMDVSASMAEVSSRIINLRKAATSLIMDVMPENSWLGLVSFSKTAETLSNLIKITSAKDRESLKNKIPERAIGSHTAIGKGLQEALKVLRAKDQNTEGAMIILITDGRENEGPNVASITKSLLDSKVIINSIALGSAAAVVLENVTVATGGKFFYVPDGLDGNIDLIGAFYESVTVQGNVEVQPVTVSNTKITLLIGVQTKRNFTIEKELGKNTIIEVSGSQIVNVDIVLTAPSGKIYDKRNTTEFSDATTMQSRKRFTFINAEKGRWAMSITTSVNTPVTFKLTSEALDPKEQPIRARSWFGDIVVKYPASAKVYAQVSKGYNAVINATVKAYIQRPVPNEVPVQIFLKDNGIGADVLKDDGIYTGYFTNFKNTGRYSAIVEVLNDGKAKIKIGTKGSGAPMKLKPKSQGVSKDQFVMDDFVSSDNPLESNEIESEQAQEFQRNVNLGAFNVEGNLAVDKIPPIKITDLQVESDPDIFPGNSEDNITVTLTWTAPGDNLDVGTVASYEIRASNNSEELITPSTFSESVYIFGNLGIKPVAAGNEQKVELTLPEALLVYGNQNPNTLDMFFTVTSTDKAKNKSPVSNIASIHYGYKAPPPKGKDDSTNVVGIVIGSIVGILVLAAIVFFALKYNRSRG